MEQQILQLILDKLDKIESGQEAMRKEMQEMKQEQQGMKQEQQGIKARIKRLEEGQEMILEFLKNMEQTLVNCEKDHEFIEKLKKVAGE
ncbi:hypothetical protein [Desulfuribacillus alkaliarsenatis]|uniref:Uncharacterized protein n=1 Tax=Desulfuribacillus alkaliarsenatis TaxID=766136 RepID=A0A1E5G3P8_9FIRM|nr:hypothetical protein [Desulfuribacillus alkaliarsenatis]OEF97636.1 hypothetical protein BHF68_14410 [Desulfuribacillus alkaliarsenatis]